MSQHYPLQRKYTVYLITTFERMGRNYLSTIPAFSRKTKQEKTRKTMKKIEFSGMWDGYCPESKLIGKTVRMRLNRHDFFESEATGLQLLVMRGVKAIVLNFRGKGDFRSTNDCGDQVDNGELICLQNTAKWPFHTADGPLAEVDDLIEFLKTMK